MLKQATTKQWGIAQKQTGADTFTLGGSLSSNVHGRGLRMKPLISNIESFTLITADGKSIRCSREENSELFRLAIGGYGIFGLIDTVTLRLVPRQKLRRVVEIIRADDLPKRFEERIAQKFLYGDFQFSVDEKSPDFLQRGVFSCYEPISADEPIVAKKELRDDDWLDLLRLAYTDREKAFKRYSDYYLSTNGQTYWSDTSQLSAYLPNYALEDSGANRGRGIEPHHHRNLCSAPGPSRFFSAGSRFVALESHNRHLRHRSVGRKR